MNTGALLKISFITSFCITIIGAYLKIVHAAGGNDLLLLGLITWFIFIVTAIYEVITSKRIDRSEKVMWTFALLLMSSIAGLIYLLSGRRRIAANS